MMIAGMPPGGFARPRPQARRAGRPPAQLEPQYGDLVPVQDTGVKRNGQRMWLCRCLRCGSYVERRQNYLTGRRATKSGQLINLTCGCGHRAAKPKRTWWVHG